MYSFFFRYVDFRLLLFDNTELTPSFFFLRVITHQGVAKKNSQLSTVSSRSSNMNNTTLVIQSTDSNTFLTANASINVTTLPTRTVNANIPQPPPSTSRALVFLSVPSHTNERVDLLSETEDDNTKKLQQLEPPMERSMAADEFNDENDYPVNSLRSTRQSSRIERSKRTYTTMSIDSSVQKKKKK